MPEPGGGRRRRGADLMEAAELIERIGRLRESALSAAARKEHGLACADLSRALDELGTAYVDPGLLEDTGIRVLRARSLKAAGAFEEAARILEDRMRLLRKKHGLPLTGGAGGGKGRS